MHIMHTHYAQSKAFTKHISRLWGAVASFIITEDQAFISSMLGHDMW